MAVQHSTKADPPKSSGLRKRSTKTAKAVPKPKQKATVKELAGVAIPEGLEPGIESKVDQHILERIKNVLLEANMRILHKPKPKLHFTWVRS